MMTCKTAERSPNDQLMMMLATTIVDLLRSRGVAWRRGLRLRERKLAEQRRPHEIHPFDALEVAAGQQQTTAARRIGSPGDLVDEAVEAVERLPEEERRTDRSAAVELPDKPSTYLPC